ncbi:hypothetical protein GOODEAATRI_007538, partial [Goodea atripinnis]
ETLFRRRFGGIFAIFPHLCTARFFGAVDPDLPRNQSEVSIFFSRLINHSGTTRRQPLRLRLCVQFCPDAVGDQMAMEMSCE